MTRTAGLRGRLPVKAPADRFPLRWAHTYLTEALPTPAYPIDVSGGIVDFGMMGNDTFGDCGPAAEVHLEMTTATAGKGAVPSPTSNVAVTRYEAFTGSATPPGPGVGLADYLLWCYQQGYIKAFAPVNHADREQCDGLMHAGYGLYVGVGLTDDAETLFNAGQPWTVADGEAPDPNEGHCILRVGTDGLLEDRYVTWGALQTASLAWSSACVEEAWLVVTTEEQLAAFEPALLADINALGGTEAPLRPVVPLPPLPPPPPPTYAPAGHHVWHREAEQWVEKAYEWVADQVAPPHARD